MAGATKYRIAEQAVRRIKGDRPDMSGLQIAALYPSIGQMASVLLRQTHFSETLPGGETVPDNTMLQTYVLDLVEYRGGNLSKCTLQVMPTGLRRMQGIRAVRGLKLVAGVWVADEYKQFIPMPGDTFEMVQRQPLLSNLLDQVGFKQEAFDLVFTENLLEGEFEKVEIKQLGVDVDQYDEFTPLPISPEAEAQIVDQLFQMYAQRLPNNPNTDLLNETAKTQQ